MVSVCGMQSVLPAGTRSEPKYVDTPLKPKSKSVCAIGRYYRQQEGCILICDWIHTPP